MQKRVVEPQADETRTESQVARAEPSRGAPDAQHTPGPWRVGPYYRHEVVSDHGVITCASIETEQSRANARLIAQAPTLLAENEKLRSGRVVLLEALKHALPILIGAIAFVDCKAVVAEVRAAIKQAERGQ